MKRAYWLLAGVMLAGGSAAPLYSANAETLEDVLATAYNSNPTLMARRAELRATDEGVPQATAGWRPTVTLTGDVGRGVYTNSVFGLSAPYQGTPRDYSLTVSEPLFRGGRTVAATEQAQAGVMAGRAVLDATEQTVLLNAATTYLNVVRDEAVLKLSINNEQVLRRQLEATQERFRVGEVTRTDVSQAEARLSQATAERVAAEGSLQNSRAAFINVVGRAPESPQPLKQEPQLPKTFDAVRDQTLAHNPNVVAADWTAKAAKNGIDLVFGELLPTVALTGTVSRMLAEQLPNNFGGIGTETTAEQAMVTLTIPLYEAGLSYSRVRAQKHTYGQRLIEADQTRRDALQGANQSWENLQSARARVASYTAQIAANELALTGVEEEAKVGSRTVLDILNAEQELFTSRVSLVTAQRDEMVAAFQLRSALGQLTAEALQLPVDVYDPRKHYDDVRDKFIGTGIDKAPGYEQ
ncbi:MAG: TolC family outer membrane protein [Magnetospirillum sp.]|nr:TolC family outer membrane protein [Magnetospirillum sp.]